jgi:hypothetical protein
VSLEISFGEIFPIDHCTLDEKVEYNRDKTIRLFVCKIMSPQKIGDVEACGPERIRGGMLLQPRPTRDPLDPLNWSKLRKNSILGIVMGM